MRCTWHRHKLRFLMANPTMNAQQTMPTMPIQHDHQHEGFCSPSPLRPCAFLVLDLTRRRKGARDAKGGVKLWLHIQLTLIQKSSVCGDVKYISAIAGKSTEWCHLWTCTAGPETLPQLISIAEQSGAPASPETSQETFSVEEGLARLFCVAW